MTSPSGPDTVENLVPAGGAVTTYQLPVPTEFPVYITAAPRRLWFTLQDRSDNAARFGKVDAIDPSSGRIVEDTLPMTGSSPAGIALGPDGNVWICEQDPGPPGQVLGRIDKINPATGQITGYPLPVPNMTPFMITPARDGALWFTAHAYGGPGIIGRITTAGAITTYPVTTANNQPYFIAAGPGGNLWYVDSHSDYIGTLNPRTGHMAAFALPSGVDAEFIVRSPDGNLWFSEYTAHALGEIQPGDLTL